MRVLADAGISPKTIEFLVTRGDEATHVRTIGLQAADDRVIVDRAIELGAVILTFDLDFGEILALGILTKPSVVIFRLTDERADSVNRRLGTVLNERSPDLESGALILVEDTRYRVRKLPIGR